MNFIGFQTAVVSIALFSSFGFGLNASEGVVENTWSGQGKAGLNMDWGNTQCTDISGGLSARRKTGTKEIVEYEYLVTSAFRYKKKGGSVSDDRADVLGSYRRYISIFWSWQASQRFEYDNIKSLSLGSHSLLTAEYWLIKNKKSSLYVDAGLGYLYKKFIDKKDSSMTVVLGGEYARELIQRLHFANRTEVVIPLGLFNSYTITDSVSLHYEFSDHWGVEGAYVWDFENSPSAGKKRLDNSLNLSVVYRI